MEKINPIDESESLSSYVSCYSRDDVKIVAPRQQTKIFTDTKSRLLSHYNDDRIYKENPRARRNYGQRMVLEHQLMKEGQSIVESSLMKYSEPTRWNQEFDIERIRSHSNNEINVIWKNDLRTEKKYGTHWRDSHLDKDFTNDISFQGVSEAKTKLLANEYYTQIRKNSTNSERASCSKVKRKLPIQGHSFTYHNNENQTIDSPSHKILKSTAVVTVQKDLLPTRYNNKLLHQLNAEQWCPPIGATASNSLKNESKLFTLNRERSNFNVYLQSMKKCLQNSSSAIKKFDLLQSLVLRLSNQESVERFATIQAIVDIDLFGIKCDNGNCTMLEDILWPINITTPHPLQTSAAKLLNVLVSHEIGRDYFNGISLVKLLTWSIKEQINDSMADNLISAMKKLSLNKFQRFDMLEKGLLQWLIHHMEAVEFTASMFRMECISDLLRILMNVENSTELAVANVPLIIVLVRYLNIKNEYVKVNIAHVLRTLFTNEYAVELGKKLNLHRFIRNQMEMASNSKLKEDLQFIYELIVKSRTHNSSKVILSVVRVKGSRFSSSEKSMHCNPPSFNKDNNDPNEKFIREKHLMGKLETNDRSEQKEIVGSYRRQRFFDSQTTILQMQVPAKPNESLPVDLGGVLQLTRDEKFMETRKMGHSPSYTLNKLNVQSDDNNPDPGAAILFSNLNSRLDHSSSLLSSGSRFKTSKCKQNAIEILKIQSIEMAARNMDNVNKDLTTVTPSKLESKRLHENRSPMITDYSDLSSIAKDPVARNDILENDSFIDELCEKVFDKLRAKLAENYFCGSNCDANSNTNCNNCCADDGAKV